MPPDQNPKHLPADERRTVTVEAVVALAAQQNPTDITTAAIAQHMGLTQGAIFRHFPSKESIVQSVLDWVSDKLMGKVNLAAQTQQSPIAALEAVFMAHMGFISEHPGAPRMLLAELQKTGDTIPKRMVVTLMTNYRARIIELLEKGKACGEVSAELDLDAASTLYVGMIQGLVIQSLAKSDADYLMANASKTFAVFKRGLVCAN
ncbi:TetR/AcrR family transcriptional regulator [Limnohabitans sp. Hippo4]|jgi:TetR/AcrR family transcriptional regulator|uniref:TetR/AcrR family transcriptional regulator n=1 Tax=Limnohabitans sp. Hippo4 TaxID=1826167 RepID=UPI000D3666E5|nr:TetR/AcrR family transcriptional regulator [Limnohabitans sp. Hippo4]PUE31643.1 TetR family transcriptional regulator [Limnohabitans sp. Hippo4]